MAINIVDKTALDNALTATAGAIRAKTGGADDLTFDMAGEKGFKGAIENSGLVKPSGNIELTQQSGTDVSGKATASVRSGSLSINTPTISSYGQVYASASLSTSGWISAAPSGKYLQLDTEMEKTVTPGTSRQTAVASKRYTTGPVYVAGDANLVAGNIKSGVSIFGVNGNLQPAKTEQSKTVTPDAAGQTVTPDSGKVLSSVTVNGDANLAAGNIKSGVSIFGVNGNLQPAKTEQSKTVTPTAAGLTVTPDSGKVLSSVTVNGDANLAAGNIKSGVSIFGVNGNLQPAKTEQSKTLTLGAAAPATVSPDSGKVLSSVPVVLDTSVIKAENIAKDVTILGVAGTHEGGGGGGGGIYGAEWSGSSDPSWARTDDAASFSDPVPYVAGATSYGSPFDNIMPWAGMQIVEDAEAGTLVSVPKFWYKLSGGGGSPLKIQIANHAVSGYSVSPMHMDRGDGKGERGIAFIGRYHCDTDYKSTTGVKPKVNITRSAARSGIHALGNNVWQGDFAMRFTIWLLYLVEYADWGSQWVIGAGCGTGSLGNVGYTDSMPYHTGTSLSSERTFGLGTQYRYIEGLWDNCYDWMDGCYYNSSGLNLIKNPASFSDSSGGTLAGLPASGTPKVMSVSTAGGYPIFYPTTTGGSYETKSGGGITAEGSYVPDYLGFYSSSPCLFVGGRFHGYANNGLFYVSSNSSVDASELLGCRLQKLP